MNKLSHVTLGTVVILIGAQTAIAGPRAWTPPTEHNPPIKVFAGKGEGEICMVPQNMPLLNKEKTPKKANELCEIDFYTDVKAEDGEIDSYAICPKGNSTNPGIDVYEIREDKGGTREKFEAVNCKKGESSRTKDGTAKKVAKLKSSLTCSYTPSIVAYYQFARALGDICEVPPSVLRTMRLDLHEDIAELGRKTAIGEHWQTFLNYDKNVAAHPELYTADGKFVYGALEKNPRGESFYSEFYNGAANYSDGPAAFGRSPVFRDVTNSAKAETFISRTFNKDSAQRMQAAIDASDMIVLDSILSQADRFGNVTSIPVMQYIDKDGKLQEVKKSKYEDMSADEKKEVDAFKPVTVKKLLLKDNDCGVIKENKMVTKLKAVERLSHMNPVTYKKLMALAKYAQDKETSETFSNYLMNELLFTTDDVKKVVGNLLLAADTFNKKCKAKQLHLDLDMENHVSANPVTASCDQ